MELSHRAGPWPLRAIVVAPRRADAGRTAVTGGYGTATAPEVGPRRDVATPGVWDTSPPPSPSPIGTTVISVAPVAA
jgi:hypothetical protein